MAFAQEVMRRWCVALLLPSLACQPAASVVPESGPTRLAILGPDYGAHPDHAGALAPGDRLDSLSLPLADRGQLELTDSLAAGPVLLVWIGGAEHEELSSWVLGLDREVAQLETRAATLVFVRPLEPEAALRWANDIPLQTTVAADPNGELASILDLTSTSGQPTPTLDFAVMILKPTGEVAYRKLGGRRPALAELLAVIDGEATSLRCCPAACVGDPCE